MLTWVQEYLVPTLTLHPLLETPPSDATITSSPFRCPGIPALYPRSSVVAPSALFASMCSLSLHFYFITFTFKKKIMYRIWQEKMCIYLFSHRNLPSIALAISATEPMSAVTGRGFFGTLQWVTCSKGYHKVVVKVQKNI